MARLQSISSVSRTWQNPKKIGHNTLAWNDGQSWGMRYHNTNVCSYDHDTCTLFISHGGWRTSTTAQRIHSALLNVGLRLSTTDLPGRWRVMDHRGNAWTIRGNSLKLRCIPVTTGRASDPRWERSN